MKKRIIAIALTLCALAGVLTVPAFAKGIANKELRAIFNENRVLLQEVTEKYVLLLEEYGRMDGYDETLAIAIQQNFERYSGIFDAADFPEISVCSGFSANSSCVIFSFELAPGISRNMVYLTDPAEQEEWPGWRRSERLAEHWFLFTENRPLLWVLRYICFGWVWMQ